MTDMEYRVLRAQFPFPWTERVFQHPRAGGIVQVLAANGQEVPLFTMTKFLTFITTRLQATAATPPSPGAAT
jgi:hypothetical protein